MRLSVALCTYNGARFLAAQLASIARQTRLPDEMVICDDGSQDSTCLLIDDFRASAPFPTRVYCHSGNMGVVSSFLGTIRLCSGDLIALCDQDDIWKSDKLARAHAAIEGGDDPLMSLYCGRLEYVDEELSRLAVSHIQMFFGFANVVV